MCTEYTSLEKCTEYTFIRNTVRLIQRITVAATEDGLVHRILARPMHHRILEPTRRLTEGMLAVEREPRALAGLA